MGIETLTDKQVDDLLACKKRVENPQSREKVEAKHKRRDFRVSSIDGVHRFTVFMRQSTKIPNSFSAGLIWHSKTGDDIILMRCNGSDHPHPNPIEGTRVDFQFHVHKTTERYIRANRKPESYATATTQYKSLNGALHELMRLANIEGLKSDLDDDQTQDLFGDPHEQH